MVPVENLRKGDIFIWDEMDWIYIVLSNNPKEDELIAAAYRIEQNHWYPRLRIPYYDYNNKIGHIMHLGNIEIAGVSYEEIDQFVNQITEEKRSVIRAGSR